MTESDQRRKNRGMEQLVARRAHNPKVTGSSPVPATTKVSRTPQKAQKRHFEGFFVFCPYVIRTKPYFIVTLL